MVKAPRATCSCSVAVTFSLPVAPALPAGVGRTLGLGVSVGTRGRVPTQVGVCSGNTVLLLPAQHAGQVALPLKPQLLHLQPKLLPSCT